MNGQWLGGMRQGEYLFETRVAPQFYIPELLAPPLIVDEDPATAEDFAKLAELLAPPMIVDEEPATAEDFAKVAEWSTKEDQCVY